VHLRRTTVWRCDEGTYIAGSVNEIGIGLFLSTVTSVVFLPVAYITGMMGIHGAYCAFVPAKTCGFNACCYRDCAFCRITFCMLMRKNAPRHLWMDSQSDSLSHTKALSRSDCVSSKATHRTPSVLGALLVVFIFPLTGMEHFQMLPRADRDQFYVPRYSRHRTHETRVAKKNHLKC
jgi:hypothetical protein